MASRCLICFSKYKIYIYNIIYHHKLLDLFLTETDLGVSVHAIGIYNRSDIGAVNKQLFLDDLHV